MTTFQLMGRGAGVPHLTERMRPASVAEQLLEVGPAPNGWCKPVRQWHSDNRPTVLIRVRHAGSRDRPKSAQYCAEHFPQSWRKLFIALVKLFITLAAWLRSPSSSLRVSG